jgi:TonB family protein
MQIKSLISGLLLCAALPASAQKKVLNHANGSKAFEGEFRYGYLNNDSRDSYNFDTATDKRRAMVMSMSARPMMDRDVAPQRIYNGKCTFYYDNGKQSFTGSYVQGIKSGLFSYWYITGEKEGECTWVDGMADGKWKWWHKNGKLRLEQSYKAFADSELDTFYNRKMSGGAMFSKGNLAQERGRIQFASPEDMKQMGGSGALRYFTEAENSMCKNAHWDGDAISYYESGRKCVEMHYANDVRVGTWYYRNDSGRALVELVFTDGKVSKIVNNLPPDAVRPGGMMPGASMAQRDSMMKATMAKNKVFPMPEKQPKPSVDENKYFKENVSMSDDAVKNNVNGMVIVTFTVNEDGTTSDHRVMKGLGYGCDEQAVNLIKAMPKWTPGETAGKPVKATFTLRVPYFKSQLKK